MTLLTIEEFGRRLKIKRTAAYVIVRRGEVDVVNVGSRLRPRLRVTEESLTRYLAKHAIRGRVA